MRLNKISPWSGQLFTPPRKVDETTAAATKPPDADDGVSGVQVQPAAASGDRPPDAPPSHALDITI